MRLFAVILNDPNGPVEKRLREAYGDQNVFPMNDRTLLVASDEITENIAVKAGIKGDDRIEDARGAVFRLNGAYAGYTAKSLWEWLSDHEQSA